MRIQQSFNFKVAIPKSAYEYGERNSGEIHGVVLTKPHVVELILDLIGYYLRFQAQYLRRIRVPDPRSIPNRLAKQISHAFYNRDFGKLDALSLEAYGIDQIPEFNFVDTRR